MHLLCYLYNSGKGVPGYPSVHPPTQLIFPESIQDAGPYVDIRSGGDKDACSLMFRL